jgi:hypothetical protein
MSRSASVPCLKCGAPATRETADTDEPMCWAHGGGDPPEVDGDPLIDPFARDFNLAEAEDE